MAKARPKVGRYAAAAAVVALIVFARVLTNDFVAYDDPLHVYENPVLSDTAAFWRAPYLRLYVPLTYTAWSLTAKLAGLEPAAFHAVNLALHCASAAMVVLLLVACGFKPRVAFVGALFFALHPLQVEAVAWVSGLKAVFGGALAIGAITLFVRRRLVAAVVVYGLALLAGPTAAAAPVVAGFVAWGFTTRSPKEIAKQLAAWVLLTIPLVIMTKQSQPDDLLTWVPPLWQRLFVAGDALSFYAGNVVLPSGLVADYGRSPRQVLASPRWLAGGVPWLVVVMLVATWHKKRAELAAVAIFIAGLLPTLGFIPFAFQKYSTVADRYAYLSMLGVAFGAAIIFDRFAAHKRAPLVAAPLVAVAVATFVALGVYRDTTTLFEHNLEINERSWMAHNNLGIALGKTGKLDESRKHFERAIELNPKYARAQNNLGMVLGLSGDARGALARFDTAVKLDPSYADAHGNRGNALKALGMVESACAAYKEALRLQPNSHVHNNLGVALGMLGRMKDAEHHFVEALRLDPKNQEARINLGRARDGR